MEIIQVFFDVHMSYAHDGLAAILEKQTGSRALPDGQSAVFINKAWTALKMLTPSGVMLYLRRPPHKPINPEAIKYLPHCVSGRELDYKKALSQVIETKWKTVVPESKRGVKKKAAKAAARRKT